MWEMVTRSLGREAGKGGRPGKATQDRKFPCRQLEHNPVEKLWETEGQAHCIPSTAGPTQAQAEWASAALRQRLQEPAAGGVHENEGLIGTGGHQQLLLQLGSLLQKKDLTDT